MIDRRQFLRASDVSRRSFLRASLFVAAAPIIVRGASLMRIRTLPELELLPMPTVNDMTREMMALLKQALGRMYSELYSDVLIFGVHARDENMERVDPTTLFTGTPHYHDAVIA